jgi:hypothetical protein
MSTAVKPKLKVLEKGKVRETSLGSRMTRGLTQKKKGAEVKDEAERHELGENLLELEGNVACLSFLERIRQDDGEQRTSTCRRHYDGGASVQSNVERKDHRLGAEAVHKIDERASPAMAGTAMFVSKSNGRIGSMAESHRPIEPRTCKHTRVADQGLYLGVLDRCC